ncbi:MAG: DNA polymerase III subunit alpha [Acidobacteriota bacterium]|nr:DNA polymerase III subunit alpha [Acidobacteriota bacterium]MDE3265108.1 DNA polymerase III subunit alpha [Acidobacteriota bacterium]
MAPDFVHLHLHSEYSLLDGGNRMERLVDRIAELGMDAVALTDHGNLFGAVAFYEACRKKGVKPILGIEAYVAPDIHTETSDRRHKETQGVADGGFHLVLLARNEIGWRNLVKLSSDSYTEGFYYKPRMDKQETLPQWNEGLIAINGHLGSSLAYHLRKHIETGSDEHYERARREAEWHRDTFPADEDGEPCFYLELQRHDTPEQEEVNGQILRLAADLDLPIVCDNDSHFLTAGDWDSHDTLICVSTGKSKRDEDRLHYPKDLYVKSPEQMAELFGAPETTGALENTRRIADRCNVELDFSANHAPLVRVERIEAPSLPAGTTEPAPGSPEPGSDAWFDRFCAGYRVEPLAEQPGEEELDALHADCDRALRELSEAGLVWRYGDRVEDAHRRRLDHELSVLAGKRISAYFLIVWDFVNEARKRHIPATARGSGVGTMVGYTLGLSHACPVRYGLLFERFTDPDRSEYPDIDIDLCQDGRAEILEYVRQKYGYVAQIITFGTMKARAAIRDVGRVHELPLAQVDRISKLIGAELGVTIEQALGREKELKELYDSDEQVREVIDTAQELEGITRHSGVHAAGLVIATQPLENLVPLATSRTQGSKDVLVTQWDGPTVEKMGLLKMDFLGLTTLSIIERCRQLVRETLPTEAIAAAVPACPEGRDPLDLDHIDLADPKVLEIFANADTAGTFQFESEGMRNLLLQMKPDRLEDLVAANALFRPGPMALIPRYCDRKHGREETPQVHEIVDRHTADTHGIMVYQEQVMQIVHELGDVPLREAYTLIKAISKKSRKTINAARQRFVDGARDKGLAKQQATQLFGLIEEFAGYGFNKSHSVGYTLLAYQTAYLKAYFPVQYMAAVLTYAADSTDKLVHYVDECARVKLPDGRGIDVGAPDIDRSGVRFHVVFEPDEKQVSGSGHIRFGLSAVKGVGEKAVRAILEAREEGDRFRSLWDFCRRVPLQIVNRSTIEALIKSGAFDRVHGKDQRAAMVEALGAAIKAGQRAAADRESGQASLLFGGGSEDSREPDDSGQELPSVPPWSASELLTHEKEALGFFASSHPLDDHRELLERFGNVTVEQLKALPADTEVVLGALLGSLRTTRTRKGRNPGQKMAMIQLEDKSARVEGVLFADAYAEYEEQLERGAVLFFTGRVDRRREEPNLVVSKVVPVEDAPVKLARRLRIHLDLRDRARAPDDALGDDLERLRALLDKRRSRSRNGGVEVEFELELQDRTVLAGANGSRAPVDDAVVSEIDDLLGARGHCRYIGAPPPSRP